MFIARVTGSIIATQKAASMTGHKLLIVEPYRLAEAKANGAGRDRLVSTGRTFIAVDALGAGEGEFVLVTQGSSARMTPETKTLPIDAVVIGLVDAVTVEGHDVFSRNA
ncbi:MAG: EutN/CcmL family microcompartment protein [Pirellulales bacterium]|jgi:microcompartment protein CcmK/EutM|nr:EutN/CcmL family microcompartment protein [Pirellulales bacterium]MDA0818093.1 EutN/CcmL family microcompartment protein [Planctomycetota bacterium]MDA0970415.1 EutN/CcmL family microcompartment protein [Planctomycetota bacterium]